MKNKNNSKVSPHPLLSYVPTTMGSYDEWKNKWEKSPHVEERLGLLHTLSLSEHCWNQESCVPFLLGIADGHCDSEYKFRLPDEREDSWDNMKKNAPAYRQMIAKKAMSVLCSRFFRRQVDRFGKVSYSWWWALEHDDICLSLFDFFLSTDAEGVKNCPYHSSERDPDQTVTMQFLKDFSRLGWMFRTICCRNEEPVDSLIEKRLIGYRPQFIEILDWCGDLYWLLSKANFDLDPASLVKLKNLALGERRHLPSLVNHWENEYRTPKNIREAIYACSSAAEVLLIYGVRHEEQHRFAKVRLVLKKQHEKKTRLQEVQKLEQQATELKRQAEALQKR